MTKEQVMQLQHGTVIHCGVCTKITGPRGGVKIFSDKWRINGKVKIWKRSENKWLVPIAKGLYEHAYIGEGKHFNKNVIIPDAFHLESDHGGNK